MVATLEKSNELDEFNLDEVSEVEPFRKDEENGEFSDENAEGDEALRLLEAPAKLPEKTNGKDWDWLGEHRHFGRCNFEVGIPNYPPLTGGLRAQVYENGRPTNSIIRADKEWSVRAHWYLKGALKDCICGYWCLNLFGESIGPGPEFVIPYHRKLIPLRPCGRGHYFHEIKVRPGYITPKHCSAPYKLVVGVTYITPCKVKGPMVGFCELPTVQFYESNKRFT